MLDFLEAQEPSVVVSLPDNDVEMATAAVDAGADAVKVHLNATHRASNTTYGTLEDEGDAIREIGELDVPVGVVPGQDVETIRRTLPNLSEYPVDFIDAFAHHLPPEAKEVTGVPTWAAPTSEYEFDEIRSLDSAPIDAIEMALFPKEAYGEPLSTRHLGSYLNVVESVSKPVVVPTQLDLRPADANTLVEHGITNFLLGSIVLGSTPESMSEITAGFVDSLR